MVRSKRWGLYKQCERVRGLCWCEGLKSAGGDRVSDAGLGPPSGQNVFWLKSTRGGGHEEKAAGVVCLCVREAFTSITLAVKLWCPS